MSKIRDERTRKKFIKYLDEHPDERFFQAIRNFTYYHISPATHIYARYGVDGEYKDTFYWPCDEMLKEEKMMAKRVMSRKDMFLAYKRELCAMDGFDDLADPLWTYLADFNLFTSDEDAEWIPVKYDGEEVGFLIALSGKLVRDDTLDYYLWDTYVKPPYRRFGLMEQTVGNYVRNHPGTYGLVMMDVNEGAHKFWESVMGKPDEIREWNWPGCRLYVYRKEKSERDRD